MKRCPLCSTEILNEDSICHGCVEAKMQSNLSNSEEDPFQGQRTQLWFFLIVVGLAWLLLLTLCLLYKPWDWE